MKHTPMNRGSNRLERAGLIVALLAWTLSGPALAAGPGDPAQLTAAAADPVQELVRSSDFVFRGTIQSTGAANLSIVEPGPTTAVVRVDAVLRKGGSLDDFTGQAVTVFLSEAASPGESRVFFTRVRLIGEALGVEEVGRAAGTAAELGPRVVAADQALLREALSTRLAAADLVVTGRVVATRPALAESSSNPTTEHDPQWRQAVLAIASTLKGRVAEKTVTFWYPASLDLHWAGVPKPQVGEQGTWLLHRDRPEAATGVYASVDSRDRLSPDEAALAAELVRP
ncbi:MAG: hypothetical protein U0002_06755 [Thermoanaerobaculia bacterium]|mgnify:CR=1 FL=1